MSITNETRWGWLHHASGQTHLMVPVGDYEETLELLDVLEDATGISLVTKKFGIRLAFWEAGAICALGLGFGWIVSRVICVCQGG